MHLLTLLFTILFLQQPTPINFDSIRSEIEVAKNSYDSIKSYLFLGGKFLTPQDADSIFYYAEVVDNIQGDTLLAKASGDFLKGLGYLRLRRWDESLPYLLRSARVFKELEEGRFYRNAISFAASAYDRMGRLDSAKYLLELQLSDPDLEKERLPAVYNNLGIVLRRLGNYNEAINAFEACIESDSLSQASVVNSYMNIASMLMEMNLPEDALNTLLQVQQLPQNPLYVAYHTNLGETYIVLEELKKADSVLNTGIRFGRQNPRYFIQLVKPLEHKAVIAMKENRMEDALSYLQEANQRCGGQCPPHMKISLARTQAEVELAAGRPEVAINTLRSVIPLGRGPVERALISVYREMGNIFADINQPDSSAHFLRLSDALEAKYKPGEQEKLIADARAKYELEKSNRELNDTRSLTQSIMKSRNLLILLAAILVIVAVTVIYLYRQSQKDMALREDELERLQQELEKQRNATQESRNIILRSKAVIELGELLYIKSDGHYLEFFLKGKSNPEIDRNTIKNIKKQLPGDKFIQVHRSYIVNTHHIRAIYSTKIMLDNGEDIRISRSFKANLMEILVNPTES